MRGALPAAPRSCAASRANGNWLVEALCRGAHVENDVDKEGKRRYNTFIQKCARAHVRHLTKQYMPQA